MKIKLIWLAGFFGCFQLHAADALKPNTFLSQYNLYAATNASIVTELTIQTNTLRITAFDSNHHNSASVVQWKPGKQWFAYIDKDMHVWAFDGEKGVWTLTADGLEAKCASAAQISQPIPDPFAKRLPKSVLKSLPKQR